MSAARRRLYRHRDARFGDSDEDPRASLVNLVNLVNLVDGMLVFACGLRAANAGAQGSLKAPKPVEKGQQIERPAFGTTQNGSG